MNTAQSLFLLAPEIFVSVLAFIVLLGEAFAPMRKKLWINLAIVGLDVVLLYFLLFFFNEMLPGAKMMGMDQFSEGLSLGFGPAFGMVLVDSQAIFFKLALVLITIIILGFSLDYHEFADAPLGTYAALLLFSLVGMMLLVSSIDFLLAVIALELLSITSFVLTGFIFKRRSSSEAAIKFFLVGTFSTAIFLFGISYYYGYFGTTHLSPILNFSAFGQKPDLILNFIFIFLISGLGFKLAMVPFHMWAPDAYEGAPTPVTAFLSVAPKVAAIGFLLRVLSEHQAMNLTPVIAVLAALTMTVGNVGALRQTNVKRLLAYSSVAQVGYILVAMVAGGALGGEATLIYTFVYVFMNLGVFAVLMIVAGQTQSEDVGTFAGLAKKSFGLSVVLILFLLSMTGIPPLAGFIGKFSIFAAILNSNYVWLGIVALINSVISLYYYFRLAHQAFFVETSETTAPLYFSPALISCLILTLCVTVVAGILPNPILQWVRNVIGS